jgi:hypothetical protein
VFYLDDNLPSVIVMMAVDGDVKRLGVF